MKRALVWLVLVSVLITSFVAVATESEVVLTEEQLAEIEASLADESKEFPVGEAFRVQVDADDLSVVEGLNQDWMNILLLGTDTGNLKLNYGRTDAMLVLSINTRTGQMKLTSLVRDMLIKIPNMKIQNRINTANAFGGPKLAMKAVNEVLGLNVRHYCSINFSGFQEIVDYLGGVTLTLSGAEAAQAGARASVEPQVLNGEQSLAYVRIRSLDSSFGRNERQRKFLAAVLEQVKKSTFDQMMGAVTAGFKAIATNLTTNEVIALLPVIVRNQDNLDMLSLPQQGAYHLTQTAAGASVVTFDQEKVRQAFHSFVYGDQQ